MNRILFERSERRADGTVVLFGVRAAHIRDVLHADVGSVLKVGEINGLVGTGRICEQTADAVHLAVTLDTPSPAPWVDLLLAVPRPKALKRLWPQLAALGVGRIVLLNAARVESVYFGTQWIQDEHARPLLIEGAMQAGTTRLPTLLVRRRFRWFLEDELDTLFPTPWRLMAHPGPVTPITLPPDVNNVRPLLAVGPEGGWTPHECELLVDRGFQPLSLGTRILRSDTACVALLAVLGHACAAHQPPQVVS